MVQQLQQHTVNAQDPSIPAAAVQPWLLGPLDSLVAYQVPVAVVFIYASDTSQPSIDLSRLQSSMSNLLSYYPHLSGRLHVDPIAGVRHIESLGTGSQLYEAKLDQPLSAFKRNGQYSILDFPGAGNDFLAPFDASFEGVRHGPIFTVQHTTFSCGAVALGIRCSHVVTDGDGFFRLVGDLARIYRELDWSGDELPRERIPCIESYGNAPGLGGALPTDEVNDLSYESRLFSVDASPSNIVPGASDHPVSSVIGRELHFTSSDITMIRKKAADPSNPHSRISTYRDPARFRMVSSDFLTPVNLRYANRLPLLPPNYFPNALLTHYTTVLPSTLASSPLHEVSRQIQDMITTESISGVEAEKTLRWITAQPNKNHIKLGFRPGLGSFMISQWSAFELYGPDSQFLDGIKPVLVSPPFTPISLIDGLAYVLPPHPVDGKDGDGLVVYLSLMEEVWEAIDQEGLLRLDHVL